MTPRAWTTAAWIIAIALLVWGAVAWPLQAPWFYLIGFAASEEAIFLLLDRPTLSQRYWSVAGSAGRVLAVLVAVGMVVLFGHLVFGWFR